MTSSRCPLCSPAERVEGSEQFKKSVAKMLRYTVYQVDIERVRPRNPDDLIFHFSDPTMVMYAAANFTREEQDLAAQFNARLAAYGSKTTP